MLCIVPGCGQECGGGAYARAWTRYCNTHRSQERRQGHPEQRPILKADLKPYLAAITKRRRVNPEHRLWAAATARWEGIVASAAGVMAASDAGGAMRDSVRRGAQEITKLAAEAKPDDVWATVAAVVMCWQREPHRFKSDRAFYVQVARMARRIGKVNCGSLWDDKAQRVRAIYRDPPVRMMVALGQQLATALGVIGVTLVKIEDAEEERRQQPRVELAEALAEFSRETLEAGR